MTFRLRVKNYRGLRNIDWSPSGVCALVGPNASGKTTLLDVPALLGDTLKQSLARAFEEHGGLEAIHSLAVPEEEPIEFDVSVGELSWRLIPAEVKGKGFRPWERVFNGHELVVSRERGGDDAMIAGQVEPARDRLAAAIAMETLPVLAPLANLLARYRLYGPYDLRDLRRRGSDESSERRLDRRGGNVFSVLRNWRDRRADKHRYEFVLGGLRTVFPDFFDDLEFSKAAQIVGADLWLHQIGKRLSASLAPDGWFVALLHLTAAASTDSDDVIAIDEIENALHPRAIKAVLSLLREWSHQHRVTVLLATHSPVLLDGFRECPEKLFVMEPEREVLPVALSDLHERSWLNHFALGDLYAHDEFGAPLNDGDANRVDHDRPV